MTESPASSDAVGPKPTAAGQAKGVSSDSTSAASTATTATTNAAATTNKPAGQQTVRTAATPVNMTPFYLVCVGRREFGKERFLGTRSWRFLFVVL